MNKADEIISHAMPSATSSNADIAAWQALPRDEQLRRLKAKFTHPDCAAVSSTTINDTLKADNRARRRTSLDEMAAVDQELGLI